MLNQRTGRITIANFCLGTHLGSERNLLNDQRGKITLKNLVILTKYLYQQKICL